MVLTKHASRRCQQRGIPEAIASLILKVGDAFDGGHGCAIVMARSKLAKEELLSEIKSLGLKHKKGWETAYVVVDPENVIVTAGHRTKKIKTKMRFN
jgi:hypothetical protein